MGEFEKIWVWKKELILIHSSQREPIANGVTVANDNLAPEGIMLWRHPVVSGGIYRRDTMVAELL